MVLDNTKLPAYVLASVLSFFGLISAICFTQIIGTVLLIILYPSITVSIDRILLFGITAIYTLMLLYGSCITFMLAIIIHQHKRKK